MRHLTVVELVDDLDGRKEGACYCCMGPVHGGKSLIVSQGDSQGVWSCVQGCEQDAIVERPALGHEKVVTPGMYPDGNA